MERDLQELTEAQVRIINVNDKVRDFILNLIENELGELLTVSEASYAKRVFTQTIDRYTKGYKGM